jgi:small subunit ribosomal protein S18
LVKNPKFIFKHFVNMANKAPCPLVGLDINYKNVELLKKYTTKFGKIVPRYYSGVTLKNQKKLANAIKKARVMALIPFVKKFDPNFEA